MIQMSDSGEEGKLNIAGQPYTPPPTLKPWYHRLRKRLRQIEFGKNTPGYREYLKLVPIAERGRYDPHTPRVKQYCSKRSFDGQVRKWKRDLHIFDP